MSERDDTLYGLLDMGEAMLQCGLPVNYVEYRIFELGMAYGASQVHVFIITSSIVVTMVFPDGEKITQSRRIVGSGGVDCRLADRLDKFAASCVQDPVSADAFAKKLDECRRLDDDLVSVVVGSVLGAAGFCVFFGGGAIDALLCSVLALLVVFLQRKVSPHLPNVFVSNVVISLITGFVVCFASLFVPGMLLDKVLIGLVMLLIPGLAATNALRDILMGETANGLLRLVETCLWAGGLACGFMVALAVTNDFVDMAPGLSNDLDGIALQLLSALIGSFGFALVFHLPKRHLVVSAFGGMLSWAVCVLVGFVAPEAFIPNCAAGAFAALFATVMAIVFRTPSTVFIVPAVIPLVPGASLFYTMSFGAVGDLTSCASYGVKTFVCALAIALGMCIVWALVGVVQKAELRRRFTSMRVKRDKEAR